MVVSGTEGRTHVQPVYLGPPLIQGAFVQPVSVVHTFEIQMAAAVIQATTYWPEARPILVMAAVWVRPHACTMVRVTWQL